MTFKDHFSQQAGAYASSRPRYPDGMFGYLADAAPQRELAIDVGTGNGQAAQGLARHFQSVLAIDGSAAQIAKAAPADNIRYECATADAIPAADGSADLVTVAQAAHWFPLDEFYAEVKRILKPGGVLAIWTYNLPRFQQDRIDDIIDTLYEDIIGPYWPEERRHVEDGYASLPFPFPRMDAPEFEMSAQWDLDHLVSYLNSWSAVQRYRDQTGLDPLESVVEGLGRAWGAPQRTRQVRFMLSLLMGRK